MNSIYSKRGAFTLFAALVVTFLLGFSMDSYADDVQWAKGFDINCTNATTREDGTPLEESEIRSIKYYVFKSGETTNPEYSYEIMGACQVVHLDTKELSTGVKDFYATIIDTDGNESNTMSVDKLTHNIMKAKPGHPSWIR
jgi:hypothetical protein